MNRFAKWAFFILVSLSLTASWWVFKDLLFPYVTSKAFVFRIFIELALPFYLYLTFSDPQLRPNWKNPLNLAITIFVLVNIASSFTGNSVSRSLWGNFERMGGSFYIGHLALLYFYVVLLGQMPGKFFQRFLKVILITSGLVAINGVFGWLHLPTLIQDPSLPTRVSSTLGNPIYLGSFAIVPMFLSLFFALQAETRVRKLGYYIVAFLFFSALFLSGTRGAAVGFLAGSFLAGVTYVFLAANRKVKILGFGIIVVLIVVAGFLFFNPKVLPENSTIQRVFSLNDSNTKARILQWQVALEGYKERPLLGTGPENYYVISNKYYNPEISKYDPSWFDKPHNYLLEILVTNGAIGFSVYLGLILLVLFALYKGFKADLYGPGEFAVLLAAVTAYQIQNLTVFDTVPASLMFYCFVGFAGFVWEASTSGAVKKQKTIKQARPNEALSFSVAGLACIIIAYVVYAANAVPMSAAKGTNYGFAYGSVDPVKANDYFQRAMNLPFNFDRTETASRYADFATSYVRANASKNPVLAGQILNQTVDALNEAVKIQPDYPITWMKLSMIYLFMSVQTGDKVTVDPRAQQSIQKAIELTPNRLDPYLTLAQIKALEGNYDEAVKILEDMLKKYPTLPSVKMQLSTIYRYANRIPEAVSMIEELRKQNFAFGSYSDFKWVIDYYVSVKNVDQALVWSELGTKLEPNNPQVFGELAGLYALSGQKEKAINLAKQVMQADPSQQKQMQSILDYFTQVPVTPTSTNIK